MATKAELAQKQKERRELAARIYKYHGWEKMPGETDKEFRRRFTKRIAVITDDKIIIQDPFGKIIKTEEKKSEKPKI